MNTAPRFLILEDDTDIQDYVRAITPPEVDFEIIETTQELHVALKKIDPTHIFLDDKVPPKKGDLPKRQFLKNAPHIKKECPTTTLYYTGSSPEFEQTTYCFKNGIEITTKQQIVEIMISLIN